MNTHDGHYFGAGQTTRNIATSRFKRASDAEEWACTREPTCTDSRGKYTTAARLRWTMPRGETIVKLYETVRKNRVHIEQCTQSSLHTLQDTIDMHEANVPPSSSFELAQQVAFWQNARISARLPLQEQMQMHLRFTLQKSL